MHICVNPRDSLSLSLENTGFLKESGQIPWRSSESSYVSFYSPGVPAVELASWQQAKTVICKKPPAQL